MTKFYQRFLALLCGALSLLAFFLISRFASVYIFLGVLVVWSGLLVALYMYIRKFDKRKKDPRLNDLVLIFLTLFGFVSLFVLMEVAITKTALAIGMSAIMVLLYSKNLYKESYISYVEKPYRRLIIVLLVFDVYAICSSLYALGLFFPRVPFWLFTIIGGIVFVYASVAIWQMYLAGKFKVFLLWTMVIFFVMIEVIWVVHLLTFGHLVSGLLTAWVWYVIQILVRFHLSKQGIIWRKQKWFLITNFILYLLILFFLVRWV